ncbi:MAG TPA: ABC transporter substrate-binding protein [Phycisphaerales bacterium]|nr:ABC transporter substrate-binding protein [Phycisphaerales bacterium]HMP37727.1 ABC transporter substrate-binding protein [Phycisphaerales bacterium]
MPTSTHDRRVLRVASALPDPPFEIPAARSQGSAVAAEAQQPPAAIVGFDVDLMNAVGALLEAEIEWVPFTGDDFNDIFRGLSTGSVTCVASGATITPSREAVALFCDPYLVSGQSLVVDRRRTPEIRSVDDLAGRTLGVQRGNTSEPVAEGLLAAGRLGALRRYPYHGVEAMLDDLERGAVDAVMKLAPVMRWFVRSRPGLAVVQERITEERLAVAVALDDAALRGAIDAAQRTLRADGTMDALLRKWIDA